MLLIRAFARDRGGAIHLVASIMREAGEMDCEAKVEGLALWGCITLCTFCAVTAPLSLGSRAHETPLTFVSGNDV